MDNVNRTLSVIISVILLSGLARLSEQQDNFYFDPAPVNQDATEGGDVRLRCDVSNRKFISFYWTLNNRQLTNTSRRFQEGGDLRILGVDRDQDSGPFRCIATNVSTGIALRSWEVRLNILSAGNNLEEVPVFPSVENNWIVLLRRFDGSVNFNKSWNEYKNGFGDMRQGEFWIGNQKIHRLTNRFAYTLRMEVYINGTWYYAEYSTFSIESENNKYTLHLSGFSGNAGDSLTNSSGLSDGYLGGMSFSTWDVDNDRYGSSCAQGEGGGWWFNSCEYACLTCHYSTNFRWYSLRHLESSGNGLLRAARMMIKRK